LHFYLGWTIHLKIQDHFELGEIPAVVEKRHFFSVAGNVQGKISWLKILGPKMGKTKGTRNSTARITPHCTALCKKRKGKLSEIKIFFYYS